LSYLLVWVAFRWRPRSHRRPRMPSRERNAS
jgi:hypothetical protein